MCIAVREEPITALTEYARVPIAFDVNRVLEIFVADHDPRAFKLLERNLEASYIKDYDAINGEGPACWAERFDISNWGFFLAHAPGRLAGGAAIALNTVGLDMLEGRRDLAVLWDIRVAPEFGGQGVGSALFRAVEKWAAERGYLQLKIETQNTNVVACRFYASQGCVLEKIDRLAYRNLPNEIQMIWYKQLMTSVPRPSTKPK